jgi:hypothetical protein
VCYRVTEGEPLVIDRGTRCLDEWLDRAQQFCGECVTQCYHC